MTLSRRERDDARFRAAQIDSAPCHARAAVGAAIRNIEKLTDYRAANQYAGRIGAQLGQAKVWLAYDADEIEARARYSARACERMTAEGAARWCESRGIPLPQGPKVDARSTHARLKTSGWWRRSMRRTYTRRAENAFRLAGLVHRGAAPYATDDAVAAHRENKRRAADWRRDTVAVCEETGELFALDDIAAKGVANPTIRRGEMMNRLKGFERIARESNHVALFFTLTCPSAYHVRNRTGAQNPSSIGAAVREAQTWLRKIWARARAELRRLSCLFYGFRVAEPHHDATPHWHLLVFAAPHHAETVARVLNERWLSEYGEEPGALEHRSQLEVIDMEREGADGRRSGAVGYMSKYIAKGVDGFAVGQDDPQETTLTGIEAAERIEVWARTHGIRQFQQIGGPSVTLWREFRRLRDALENNVLESIRSAVDRGDWAGYIAALGGIEGAQRMTRERVRLWTEEPETADEVFGPLPVLNRWGERAAPRVLGVLFQGRAGTVTARTRFAQWRLIQKRNNPAPGSDPFMTRTRGNNYTGAAPDIAAAWSAPMPEPADISPHPYRLPRRQALERGSKHDPGPNDSSASAAARYSSASASSGHIRRRPG